MCNSKFWTALECSYNVQIPVYVKNIMEEMGYNNPITFQGITKATISEIEDIIRDGKGFVVPDKLKKLYLGDLFCHCQEDFRFMPGDRDLILGLADRVQQHSDVFKKLLNY